MSMDKLVNEFKSACSFCVIDRFCIKPSVNLFSTSNLNQLLVIVWQKDKKKKRYRDLTSIVLIKSVPTQINCLYKYTTNICCNPSNISNKNHHVLA